MIGWFVLPHRVSEVRNNTANMSDDSVILVGLVLATKGKEKLSNLHLSVSEV